MTTTGDIPTRIGRYQILTKLAVGGMAEIFLACERGMGGLERTVVIKRILPHLSSNPSFVDMFLREARIIARLSHPNVVQIYDLGQDGGDYFIAMEYIHGSTVRELQVLSSQAGNWVPLEVVVGMVSQACRGAHAAHELADLDGSPLGLVHRDISPHNLMVTGEGLVKLLDFGVAKGTEGTEETYSGSLKGKFAYMSPEQCRHEKLDRRSDVFALGIVAWELCAGKKLFKRDSELQMLKAITEEAIPAPSESNSQVPMLLDLLVLKALSRERDDRFESADELRRALEDLAAKLGWDTSQDRVAAFARSTASTQLEQRRTIVQKAIDRSLDSSELRSLKHETSTESMTVRDPDGERTKALAKSRDTAETTTTGATVPAIPSATTQPSVGTQTVVAGGNKVATVAAVAALVVAVAVAAAFIWQMQNKGHGDEEGVSADAEVASPVADVEAGADVADEPDGELVLEGPPLKFGWAPTVDPEVLREETAVLKEYLERELKRPVPIVLTDSYADLSERLQNNEVQFASLPPLLYTRTKLAEPKIDVLAIKEFDGASRSDGYLLVLQESPVTSVDQLEGKTFCFTNPNSTTGYFLPRHYLRSQGKEPSEFIGKIHWSGDHLQLLRDVVDKKCAAGATYSGAFLTGGKFGVPVGKLRLLAVTGYTPQDSIVAAPNISASDRDAFVKALLRFDPKKHAGVDAVGKSQRITGFSIPEREPFERLRKMVLAEDASAIEP